MAKLYFRYGAMGSSKSANILMVHHNYKERGQYAQWQRKIGGFIQRPFLDSQMFYKDSALIGENGTTYNGDLIDSRMAHIDENGNPGYFSNGWNK